jgi:iron complex transport system substrate-binding protein
MVAALLLFSLSEASAEEITVIDANGRKVKVPENPQRIVVLTSSAMELIRLMGAEDRVIGVASHVAMRKAILPGKSHVTDVGRGFSPDLELLVRLKPDLLITWSDKPGPDLDVRLEELGISLLRLDLFLISSLPRETRVLAEVLGGEAPLKAEAYLSWLDYHRERASSLIENYDSPRPSILMEHFPEYMAVGPGAGAYELAEFSKARNLGDILPNDSNLVDAEWYVLQNPDYFIKLISLPGVEDPLEMKRRKDEMKSHVMGRRGLRDLDFVKNGRVLVSDAEIGAGPRYPAGLYEICHFLYPDLVPPNASEEAHGEYLSGFLGIGP